MSNEDYSNVNFNYINFDLCYVHIFVWSTTEQVNVQGSGCRPLFRDHKCSLCIHQALPEKNQICQHPRVKRFFEIKFYYICWCSPNSERLVGNVARTCGEIAQVPSLYPASQNFFFEFSVFQFLSFLYREKNCLSFTRRPEKISGYIILLHTYKLSQK